MGPEPTAHARSARLRARAGTRGASSWLLAGLCAVAITAFGVCPELARSDTPAAPSPDSSPVQVTADRLEYEVERELFVAEGHVRIVRADRSIDADWVVVSRDTQRGIASGHVVYRDGDEVLRSQLLQFDVETLQGLVYQAHLDTGEGGYLVDADRLVRSADKTYTVRSGRFTTCRCEEGEREPWVIDAGRARVKVGGYALAQNTTLDILGVPIVWLPWLIFPVKTERESGVLFPNLGFRGQAGFEVGLPLFWAARENVGVIATPTYMTKRGFKQNLELEALIGDRSRAKVFAAFGRDQRRMDEKPPAGERRNEDRIDRYTVLVDYDQWLPGGWRAKADISLISDNQYVTDFAELTDFRQDLFLESEIFGFRHFGSDGRLGVVGSVVHYNDLQEEDDSRDRDAFLHQRLPGVRVDIMSGPTPGLKGLVTRFEFDYTNYFARRSAKNEFGTEDLVGDDLFLDQGVDGGSFLQEFETDAGEGNGFFDEGELLADQGHRFVLHPRIAYPLRLWDRFELYPEVGYRETFYTTRAQNFAEQGRITARVDLRTRVVGNPLGGSLQHIVEPTLGWSFVGNASSSGDPLFVPATAAPQHRLRQFERDNLLADPSDRVNRRNTFTFGIANRLYRDGRLRGTLNLSYDYHLVGNGTDHSVTQRDKNFSRLLVAGETSSLYRTSTRYNLTYDPRKGRVEEGLFSFTVIPRPWVELSAGYRYRAPIPASTARFFSQINADEPWDKKTAALNQVSPGVTFNLGSRLRLKYFAHYDFHERSLLTQQGGFEYRSKCNCWAIGVDVQRLTDNEIRYQLRYSLLGAGDDSLRAGAFANSGSVLGK